MARRPTTRSLPGALSIGNAGGTVRLNPNATALLGQVLPKATTRNSGVMTAEQVQALESASGGGSAETFATAGDFPDAALNQGKFVIASDTNLLYCANNGDWFPIVVLAL